MPSEIASRFIQTLQHTEETGNIEPLVALFSDDTELFNLAMPEPLKGKDGAYRFWKKYLSVFERIHSQFINVVESNNTLVVATHNTKRSGPQSSAFWDQIKGLVSFW